MKKEGSHLRLALGQINPIVGDLEGNARKILTVYQKALKYTPDILIFPELALCGYPPEDLLLKEHFLLDNKAVIGKLAKKIRRIPVIIGYAHRARARCVYNAACVIDKGKIRAVYKKTILPNYGIFDEKRYFEPGMDNQMLKIGARRIGLSICEDIWHPEGPCRDQITSGAQMLVNISASPYQVGKLASRIRLIQSFARKHHVPVCYVNLVGGQDELIFDGGSFVCRKNGRIAAMAGEFAEDLVIQDLSESDFAHRKVSAAGGRRIPAVVLTARKKRPRKEAPARPVKHLKVIEQIYRALVLGVGDYVRKNGFKQVLIGLSGGIDSACTAAIACAAIGRKNVIGLSMPTKFSSRGARTDAKILAQNLGIAFDEVPIGHLLTAYEKTFERFFQGTKKGAAEENIQARIRGNILMSFSNKFGWLVLTTGNKSEMAVGYSTLYGDMAGGFAVIKDVPKTRVYELAHYINSLEAKTIIPESTIRRAPSAELAYHQKDTDTLPPYEVLDPILQYYVERDYSTRKIKAKIRGGSTINDVVSMVDRNEYKRRQSPPGIKITSKAFGRDRRLPITNRYKDN